jgi:hypothetical protein
LRERAGSMPCTFDTLIDPDFESSTSEKTEIEIPTFKTWSGLSSNDGSGLV